MEAEIPRFFFSFTNGQRRVRDYQGEALRDEAAAREHAIEDARYLLQHNRTGMTAEGGWQVEVSDHDGRVLFLIPFARVSDTDKAEKLHSGA